MPSALRRYQQTGDLHFVTFSCYHRLAYLGSTSARELFERSLETIRKRYSLFVTGYVVMPEHVHLLVSEPLIETLAKALQSLKSPWRFSARKGRFGSGDTMISTSTPKRSASRSCVICTAIQWCGVWSQIQRTGSGRVSAITQPEFAKPWRSNRSGQQLDEGVCPTTAECWREERKPTSQK